VDVNGSPLDSPQLSDVYALEDKFQPACPQMLAKKVAKSERFRLPGAQETRGSADL
jgi:hypothetical protein